MKVLLSVLIKLILCSCIINSAYSDNSKDFRIFDATAYKFKPDFIEYGIEPIEIAYVSHLYPHWPNISNNELPSDEIITKLARKHSKPNVPFVIDIEHWKLRGESSTINDTINKYRMVLQKFKKNEPNLQLGIYGVLPITEYHQALEKPGSVANIKLVRNNARLFDISKDVDFIFPSLYTFNFNKPKWVKFATTQLVEAKRYNKPIYAFVWPQIHDSNKIFKKQYLSYQYWMLELETIYKYADGIVIWGGYKDGGPEAWDETAEWWRATQDFIKEKSLNSELLDN